MWQPHHDGEALRCHGGTRRDLGDGAPLRAAALTAAAAAAAAGAGRGQHAQRHGVAAPALRAAAAGDVPSCSSAS